MKTIKILETAEEIIELGYEKELSITLDFNTNLVTFAKQNDEYQISGLITARDFVQKLAESKPTKITVAVMYYAPTVLPPLPQKDQGAWPWQPYQPIWIGNTSAPQIKPPLVVTM